MTEFQDYATMKGETPFDHLVPGRVLPVAYPLPFIPAAKAPPCYLIDIHQLDPELVRSLVQILAEKHQAPFDAVMAEVQAHNLPMNCEWFSGVTIRNQSTIASILSGLEVDFDGNLEEFECGAHVDLYDPEEEESDPE